MISRTAFFVGLLGCTMLAGCNGSGNKATTETQVEDSGTFEADALKSKIDGLNSQITGLTNENEVLRAENTTLKDTVAVNLAAIADLSRQLDGLKTTLASMPTSVSVAELTAKADGLSRDLAVKDTALKRLMAELGDLPEGQSVESLVAKINSTTTEITGLINKIYALTAEVDALKNPVADTNKPPVAPAENKDSWVIVNRNFNETYLNQPFVSNGYIGLRIPAAGQGYWTGSKNPDLIGPYTNVGARYTSAMVEGLYSESRRLLATLPNWSSLTIRDGSEEDATFFDPTYLEPDDVSEYVQTIDMRKGVVTTSLVWTSPRSDFRRNVHKKVRLKWTTFAHRTEKHLGVTRLEVTPLDWTGDIHVESFLDMGGVRRARSTGQEWQDASGLGAQASIRTEAVTGFKATTAFKMDIPPEAGTTGELKRLPLASGLYWNFTPQKDKTYTFTKYVGIATSIDKELVEPLGTAVPQTFADGETSVNDAADGTAKDAKLKGFDALLAEHKDAWEALWNKSSITVENPRLQQIINSAQFELLSSTYEGSRASIPVSGLVGTGYGGMIFWDAETWMYPYLLLTHPELAKSIVDYRFDTLPAARQNLNSSDFVNDEGTKPYKGAYFPWVSGVGVMENGIGERERRQLHLQGDIALAQYQYYAATGDTKFLRDQVWPIVSDIADFYTTRGNYNADGLFTLTNVTGPDEYASNVTTEAYNNAVAIEAFNIAIKTAKLLDLPAPETWTNARDEMVRPLLDPSRQTHLQYEGFNLANPNNKIKQADVVLLSYPLEYPMTKEQATNNLEYYSSAADRDGPAMTDAVHAVIAAQLGSCDFGTFMKKSYDAALGPYVHFNETRAVGPSGEQTAPANIFVTAAGGFLQGVGMGMTGYRFHDDRIVLSPILPESIEEAPAKRAYFKGLKWQGREFNVDIGTTDTWVTLTSGGDAPLEVTADGGVEKFTLTKDVPLKLQTRKAAKADGTPCNPLPSSDLIKLP